MGSSFTAPLSPRVVLFMPRIGPVCCRQRKVIVRPIVGRDRGDSRKTKANEKGNFSYRLSEGGPPCAFRAACSGSNDQRARPSHARAAFRARPWIEASLPPRPCPEASRWEVEDRSSCISVSRLILPVPRDCTALAVLYCAGAGWRPMWMCILQSFDKNVGSADWMMGPSPYTTTTLWTIRYLESPGWRSGGGNRNDSSMSYGIRVHTQGILCLFRSGLSPDASSGRKPRRRRMTVLSAGNESHHRTPRRVSWTQNARRCLSSIESGTSGWTRLDKPAQYGFR
ncbi:hypothetical protein B0J18DRAFT_197363 [Chaetomium sp. MPI-SDFR-AT-0129]|nr:hypothetical protein B0J18DRAFT_197363 [Chaetomium sp. MPI-SDFR-AT-0129]